MKIAIVGASGQTGAYLIERTLERGHNVIAVARSPHKIDRKNARLEIRKADAFDQESITSALAGADAVVTSIGKTDLRDKRIDINTTGHTSVLAGMKTNGIKRLIAISSFGAALGVKRPGLRRKIYLFFRRKYYGDMREMERMVLNGGINATVVRAPMLHDRPPRNKYLKTNDGTLPPGVAVSRADLATFILDELEADEHIGEIVAIADHGMDAPPMREIMPKRN